LETIPHVSIFRAFGRESTRPFLLFYTSRFMNVPFVRPTRRGFAVNTWLLPARGRILVRVYDCRVASTKTLEDDGRDPKRNGARTFVCVVRFRKPRRDLPAETAYDVLNVRTSCELYACSVSVRISNAVMCGRSVFRDRL